MYNSHACWKGSKCVIKKNLKKLGSKMATLEALKENIKMQTIGYGLDECKILWSTKGEPRLVDELAARLE